MVFFKSSFYQKFPSMVDVCFQSFIGRNEMVFMKDMTLNSINTNECKTMTIGN